VVRQRRVCVCVLRVYKCMYLRSLSRVLPNIGKHPVIALVMHRSWSVALRHSTDFRKKIGKAFSNYFNEIIKFNGVDQVCGQRFLDYNYLTISFYL